MDIASLLRGLFGRGQVAHSQAVPPGSPREFIYLDDVSVYSILASREGSIATEITESQTTSVSSEAGGSLDAGLGVARASLNAKLQADESQGAQVLRKAIVQTSFKELYDIERDALRLGPLDTDLTPEINTIADLKARLDSHPNDKWVVDPDSVCRGELLELEVELEAEPIFHMATMITTICELMENNELLLQHTASDQIGQMRSVAQVLEGMLVDLVPIRGRLVDYECASIDGRDILCRRSILKNLPADIRPETHPVFIVGVAQRDLFWKDIRLVLFSKARHTVFGRLATRGLTDKWNPVKLADVLKGIVPSFDQAVQEFSKQAHLAMSTAPVEISPTASGNKSQYGQKALNEYAVLLADHHSRELTPDALDDLRRVVPQAGDWLETVDGQRPVFAEVKSRVETALEVKTPPEVAHNLRREALRKAGLVGILTPNSSSEGDGQPSPVVPAERFLDAEIIAVYW